MGRLGKFVALSPAERRMLVGAAGLLATVRVGLWVLPFRWVHGAVRAFGNRPRSLQEDGPPVRKFGMDSGYPMSKTLPSSALPPRASGV